MQQLEGTSEDVQALFRQVNERVLEANRSLGPTARLVDFVCECRDPECTDRLTLSVAQFDAIRGHPAWRLVRPGHSLPIHERTIEIHKGFAVVATVPGEPPAVAAPLAAA
jgi:hypothetical protein